MDPVREAERVLRGGHRPRRGWWAALAVVLVAGFVMAAVVAPGPTRPIRSWSTVAVLKAGESSPWCAEGVADVSGRAWSTPSDSVDRLHLPMRGKLKVVDAAYAVFTAHKIKVPLSPAMPCTPG